MSRWSLPSVGAPKRIVRLAGAATLALSMLLPTVSPALARGPLATPKSGSVEVSYTMGLNGITIGRFNLAAGFDGANYTLAVRGMTSGLSRLVSDGTGWLSSSGDIDGGVVRPDDYVLRTTEGGHTSSVVAMHMRAGTIVTLTALPPLPIKADRVPLRPQHTHQIVDPLSAMIAPLYPNDMGRACNRTIPVFDGWQRFDVRLFYKSTAEVKGEKGSYSGTVYVCGARYVAVAGHRPSREQVQFMERNTNLEVWLAPAEAVGVMLPYRMVIGTEGGILTMHASRFVVRADDERSAAN